MQTTFEIDEASTARTDWDQRDATNQARQPIVPDEFATGAACLKDIFQQLSLLWKNVDEDSGDVQPTVDALQRTFEILESTSYAMMQMSFPRGYVTTDGAGGIRIEWWHERTHCVTLVVDATDRSKNYVFAKYGEDDDGRIDNRVFANRLAAQLVRLTEISDNPQ